MKWEPPVRAPWVEKVVAYGHVGSRCAGSSTARLLAEKGRSVLMVDRTHFPSDGTSMVDALSAYQASRDEFAQDVFETTQQMLSQVFGHVIDRHLRTRWPRARTGPQLVPYDPSLPNPYAGQPRKGD